MPIQVNEIVIRAVVAGPESSDKANAAPAQFDREVLIAECVEQVLEILKEKAER